MKENNASVKEILIRKSIELFYKKGYADSSVRDIVRAAGVTNATLYTHFKDKEDLLYKIIKEIGDRILNKLNEIQTMYNHPLDRLSMMFSILICHFLEKKKEVKIFLEELDQLSSPKLKRDIRKQQRIIYEFYKRQIGDLEKLGLLRPGNKVITTFACLSLINWCYRWFREDRELTLKEVSDLLKDLFLYGIIDKTKKIK